MTVLFDVPAHLAAGLGPDVRVPRDLQALREAVAGVDGPTTVVLGAAVPLTVATLLAADLRLDRPEVGVVLLRDEVSAQVLTEALRAGVREVVRTDRADALDRADGLDGARPADGEDGSDGLVAAVRRSDELGRAIAGRAGGSSDAQRTTGRVITVFSAKGGCGKTTMATNIAAALADGGRRSVVLVDLDLAFGDVAIALQLFPTRTIADAVPMGELDFEGVRSLLTPHSPGLTTLVAPLEPGAAESVPASLVTRLLELLREQFDYVVVDTPPAFDDQVLAAFDLSDSLVLLATLDIPALKNLKLTLETLDMLSYPRSRWSIVLNRADSKVGLSVAEVEKTLRTSITAQVPSSRDVPASINRGVPIVLDDPSHVVSVAVRAFAADRLAAPGGPTGPGVRPRPDRRGFLRRRSRA